MELLDEDAEERGTLRLPALCPIGGAGVDVAVANGSELDACEEPHDGQKRAPDWISVPQEEQ
jgi:hypothetical protein